MNRVVWADWARAFAIVSVVLCHAVGEIYDFSPQGMMATNTSSAIVAVICFTVGRLGVPIFLFLSGYFLLDRQYDDEGCVRFWKTKLLPLFVVTLVWFVIYDVIVYVDNLNPMSLSIFVRNLLMLENVPMPHVWYMPMIIGFYVTIPFAANALRAFSPKCLVFPVLLASVLSFALPTLNVFLLNLGQAGYLSVISNGFSGGTYGVYLVLGYMIKKGCFSRVPTPLFALGGFVAFVVTVAQQCWTVATGTADFVYFVWYDNAFLALCALSIAVVLSRLPLREHTAIGSLSYYSFAMYLVHFPILAHMYHNLIEPLGMARPLSMLVLFVAVSAASMTASWLIAKIPHVGKRLLNLK